MTADLTKLSDDELKVRVARAHSAGLIATRRLARARKRAGATPDSAGRRERRQGELSDAVDFFAVDDWGNASTEEIRKAAGRIERIAASIIAGESLPALREEVEAWGQVRRDLVEELRRRDR